MELLITMIFEQCNSIQFSLKTYNIRRQEMLTCFIKAEKSFILCPMSHILLFMMLLLQQAYDNATHYKKTQGEGNLGNPVSNPFSSYTTNYNVIYYDCFSVRISFISRYWFHLSSSYDSCTWYRQKLEKRRHKIILRPCHNRNVSMEEDTLY